MNTPKKLNECFDEVIQNRGWYKNSGTDRRIAATDKIAFKNGMLSEKKIKIYLEAAGYKLYQPELWIKE